MDAFMPRSGAWTSRSPTACLFVLSLRELGRQRFGLLLLFVIPPAFLGIVEWTSGNLTVPLNLLLEGTVRPVLLPQRTVSLVFVAAAVCGFLASYYALILFHRNFAYFEQCLAMGLAPTSLLVSRFAFFAAVVSALAALTTVTLHLMCPVMDPFGTFLGFALVAAVYGAYGGLVGVATRDFMVALLAAALLANLDAGWLQNPVFFGTAQHQAVLRWLPAFHPTQVVFSSAFADLINLRSVLFSLLYAAGLLAAMLLLLRFRVRSLRRWWE
jgi:hypothetical protein